ncbi:MAG TPA: c-type cytochrome, partial [Bacteroidota bacterium]|nr:c-type cytochrome [Bacteroidota bacterium]
MNRWTAVSAACCALFVAGGFAWHGPRNPQAAHEHAAPQDSSRRAEDRALVEHELSELREKIAGREKQPASEVFKNIQLFKTMEAGRLPGMMGSWSNALGVTCKHCHVIDQWEKEDRPEKQIARDMVGMVSEINTHLLKNIKNLDSPEPRIGCWTCHRG